MKKTTELNFDGLVGNTHNYAGLSFGNVASSNNKGLVSSPKSAALQGLAKMKSMRDLGLIQGIIPPHIRPHIDFLRSIGFSGDNQTVLNKAKSHPHFLNASYSASNMWVANAATITPSSDTFDGKVHFTPANLSSMLHRSIEYEQTSRALKSIFSNPKYFVHHNALQANIHSDEGAANHTRFCHDYQKKGVHLFVYGKSIYKNEPCPKVFPARQTKESFEAIARLHQLDENYCVFALQNPAVIDKGVFHNDVISVGNKNVFFVHEKAFAYQEKVYTELSNKLENNFEIIEVPNSIVSIDDAVSSYLFNSQLISTESGMLLIAPNNCRDNQAVNNYIKLLIKGKNSISDVKFFDVKQSMANGGGPACLRLRVVLTEEEIDNLSGRVILDNRLYNDLVDWVNEYYRDSLSPDELSDISLLHETKKALLSLGNIIRLPNLYNWDKNE